jgi:hypothetical protein
MKEYKYIFDMYCNIPGLKEILENGEKAFFYRGHDSSKTLNNIFYKSLEDYSFDGGDERMYSLNFVEFTAGYDRTLQGQGISTYKPRDMLE